MSKISLVQKIEEFHENELTQVMITYDRKNLFECEAELQNYTKDYCVIRTNHSYLAEQIFYRLGQTFLSKLVIKLKRLSSVEREHIISRLTSREVQSLLTGLQDGSVSVKDAYRWLIGSSNYGEFQKYAMRLDTRLAQAKVLNNLVVCGRHAGVLKGLVLILDNAMLSPIEVLKMMSSLHLLFDMQKHLFVLMCVHEEDDLAPFLKDAVVV